VIFELGRQFRLSGSPVEQRLGVILRSSGGGMPADFMPSANGRCENARQASALGQKITLPIFLSSWEKLGLRPCVLIVIADGPRSQPGVAQRLMPRGAQYRGWLP
jgi:hypothetical protein